MIEDGIIGTTTGGKQQVTQSVPQPAAQAQNYVKPPMRAMSPIMGYPAYYDTTAISDFYRFTQPTGFMDGYQMGPPPQSAYAQPGGGTMGPKSGTDTLTQTCREFYEKYMKMPHKRSHTHAIIAYYIYGCQTHAGIKTGTVDRKVSGTYAKQATERCTNMNGRLLNMPTHP